MQRQSIWSKPRFSWSRLLPRKRTFSPEEVCLRLRRSDSDCKRTAAVHEAAAQTAIWSGLLSDKTACELGAAGHRLPSVVLWHSQGLSLEAIGRRLSPLGGPWDAERALITASTLIAHILNEPGFVDSLAV